MKNGKSIEFEINNEELLRALDEAFDKMYRLACTECGAIPSVWGNCGNCGEYYALVHDEKCFRYENMEDLLAESKFWNHADHNNCDAECCRLGHSPAISATLEDDLQNL
jgi:hypothetical protein